MLTDQPLFEELIDRHSAELYRYLWRLMRDPDDAQDCLQETYLRAFKGYAHLKSADSLRAWLYKIATNVARTHGGRRARLLARTTELNDEMPAHGESAGGELAGAGRLTEVLQMVNRLPYRQREALMMRKYQGLTYEEIGTVLGCSPTASRAHVYQALRKLRRQFEPDAFGRLAEEVVG